MSHRNTWLGIIAWSCLFVLLDVFTFMEMVNATVWGGGALLGHWLSNWIGDL